MAPPAPGRRAAAPQPPTPLAAGDILLYGALVTVALIFFLFTPYTHMLDEIKNSLLYSLAPGLLLGAVCLADLGRVRWKTHASLLLLGMFAGAHVLSFVINPHKIVGETVLWFQVACMTFTAVFALFIDAESKLRRTMTFMTVVCFLSTLVGLFLYAGQNFSGSIYEYASARGWAREWRTLFYTFSRSREMYSTILNPDFYAAFLVMTTPIALSMFFVETRLALKTLAIATFLLMNVCLVFTNSNDSFVSAAVMYLLYFVLGWRYVKEWNLSRRLLLTFLACAAVLALTVFILMLPTLAVTWDFKSNALEGRMVLWSGGFWPWIYRNDHTMTHVDWTAILFGTGPGGYRFYFPVFRRPDFFDNQINNVTNFGHNYYLDILLEFGLLGLVLFLAFCGKVLWDALRQVRRTSNRVYRLYQMAMICGLVGIAIQNITSPNNRWAVCGMIFYSMFGFSMALHHLDNPGVSAAAGDVRAHRRLRVARGVLCAFAVVFLVRSFPLGVYWFEGALADTMARQLMETAAVRPREEQPVFRQAARMLFEKAIKTNPAFATSYYRLGHVLSSVGETTESIRVYEKLQEINPHYSELQHNLGTAHYLRAMELGGDERLRALEKAHEYAREGARQELKPAVQHRAAAICRELAAQYEDAGREDGARELYREARRYYWNIVNYKPRDILCAADRKRLYPEAQKDIARLAYRTGDFDDVEKILELMYWEDPSRTEYLLALLTFFDSSGKLAEKREFLDKAVHSDPFDVELRKRLADAHRQANDTAAYRREMQRIEVLEPGNKTALAGIYLASKQEGRQDRAEEYAAKLRAAGLSPDKITTTALESLENDAGTSVPLADTTGTRPAANR